MEEIIAEGSYVSLALNTDKINVFNDDGTKNILAGVQNDLVEKGVSGE